MKGNLKNRLVDQSDNSNFAADMSDKKNNKSVHLFEGWTFGKINYIIFTIGVGLLLIGYALMATGTVSSFQSLSLAPVILFVSYIIVIPLALVYRQKK